MKLKVIAFKHKSVIKDLLWSEVKGELYWLFYSATVVEAEVLAERQLSGPANH
jgi:hypothetical protein